MIQKKIDSNHYSQPAGPYFSRKLEGVEESIDYLPEYKYRIWYNDQVMDFPPHKHTALEIIVCTENIYTVSINEQTVKMHEGDILFVPPSVLHQIVSPDSGARFILLFDLEFLNIFRTQPLITTFLSKSHLYNIATHPHIYPTTYALLTKIMQAYFSNDAMSEISIYSDFLEMITVLCGNANPQAGSNATKHTDSYDKFVNILSYIDTNYAEDLTLEKVAGTAGFSKFHFSRMFKQYTSTTFYEYLCHKRILVAQELLTKNIPVTDIAFQTGFNNLTTFCRCFKKYLGCSPTQYRSQFASEDAKAITNAAMNSLHSNH